MSSTFKITSFSQFKGQFPLCEYYFHTLDLTTRHSNMIVIKPDCEKNVTSVDKYDEMVNTIISKLLAASSSVDFLEVAMSWNVSIPKYNYSVHGPVMIDPVKGCADASVADWMDSTPNFGLNKLFYVDAQAWMETAPTFNLSALFHLDVPLPWTEPITNIGLNKLFYVDTQHWMETALTFNLNALFHLDAPDPWMDSTVNFGLTDLFYIDTREWIKSSVNLGLNDLFYIDTQAWMETALTFELHSLFHLDAPVAWTEITNSFDINKLFYLDTTLWMETESFGIDVMFSRDISEHKYDECGLHWLIPEVKIDIDKHSWIEHTDSFSTDTMIAREIDEHKYDSYDLSLLFNTPEIFEEVREEPYADCDLSWLFPVEKVDEYDNYYDYHLSLLFQTIIYINVREIEEEPENYHPELWRFKKKEETHDEYDLSWLFSKTEPVFERPHHYIHDPELWDDLPSTDSDAETLFEAPLEKLAAAISHNESISTDTEVKEIEDEDCKAVFQIYKFLTETKKSKKWLVLLSAV